MTDQLVRITNEVEIPYLTYSGQPVLTFVLIDKVHGRPEGTARRNFNANKERFIGREDYFLLSQSDMESMDEFRTSANPKGIMLITESGYLMLVKSFTDDLSWQIQRQLVKLYFRMKGLAEHPAPQPTLSNEQWQVIRDLVFGIERCCHWQGAAGHAAYERIRFAFGLRNSRDLHPEQFAEAKSDLEGVKMLAEQHQERMATLDREFIATVIRPPVSIRKVRALVKRQGQQPPLTF